MLICVAFCEFVRMRHEAAIALVMLLAGCAHEPPAARVVERVRTLCPTDDQLRDIAIEVSKATYRNAPGSSRECACPDDSYERNGKAVSCSAPGAIRPASWVMCRRSDVPAILVAEMKAKLPRRCT
jgi:hypothetical protein